MIYVVYRADFQTKANTWRIYVGFTTARGLSKRFQELGQPNPKQPAWCRAGFKRGSIRVVVRDLPSVHTALAVEALCAARAITQAPRRARGGPWLLADVDRAEIKMAASCATMSDLFSLLPSLGSGSSLRAHLANTSFRSLPASGGKAPRGAPKDVLRVMRRRRSGKPGRTRTTPSASGQSGHKYRQRCVAEGKFKVGDKDERRLHRGNNSKAAREREYTSRKRRAGD